MQDANTFKMHTSVCKREGEVKTFLRLTPGLLKPACESITVAIGFGLPFVEVVAGVPPSGVLVVTGTFGSQAVAVSGLLLVKGWGPFLRLLPVAVLAENVCVRTRRFISLFFCGTGLEMFDWGLAFSWSAKVRERALDRFSTTRTFCSGSKVGEKTLHLLAVTLCLS